MSTPHERLIRTTFSLPFGEVHALVGGAVNARPLLFLHGFPDHPPTAVPFLEHLAETQRVVAPWLRGYAPSPIVGPYDLDTLAADALALIDRPRVTACSFSDILCFVQWQQRNPKKPEIDETLSPSKTNFRLIAVMLLCITNKVLAAV